MHSLELAAMAILDVFLGLAAAIILVQMMMGKISLKGLVSEPLSPRAKDGTQSDASISRFQFLIFTFVVAVTFFIVVLGQKPPQIPKVPTSVLVLLGISGSSYVTSKGIQHFSGRQGNQAGTDQDGEPSRKG